MDTRGLKKAKCAYWREIGECTQTTTPVEECATPDGYCLSIIVDTSLPQGEY